MVVQIAVGYEVFSDRFPCPPLNMTLSPLSSLARREQLLNPSGLRFPTQNVRMRWSEASQCWCSARPRCGAKVSPTSWPASSLSIPHGQRGQYARQRQRRGQSRQHVTPSRAIQPRSSIPHGFQVQGRTLEPDAVRNRWQAKPSWIGCATLLSAWTPSWPRWCVCMPRGLQGLAGACVVRMACHPERHILLIPNFTQLFFCYQY